MLPLIIQSHFGEHYQVLSQWQAAVSCGERVTSHDDSLLFSIITRELTIAADEWCGVLMRLGVSIPPNFFHAHSIYHELVQLLQRGELRLVKIPRLERLPAIAAEKGWGYCFTRGPDRHPSLSYSPVNIDSLQAANTFLDTLNMSEHDISRLLPLTRVVTRADLAALLANHSILAYKIPVTTAAPAPKPVEYLPATAADRPVPLAPETKKTTPAPTPAEKPEANVKQNLEIEKREQELKQIGVKLRSEGYFPTSDADIQNAVQTGQLGNPRYLVSIQKSKSHDEPVGFRRPDTGRTTMWTTTYDMLKKGDLSAPLLMALLGSTYEPAAEYTMFILDQGENFEQDGALTFSPTWDNMKKHCPDELHKDNPKDPIRDKELLASVMNPETQVKYKQTMESFWADTKGTKMSEYNPKHIEKYLADKGFSEEESDQFKARHLYRTQIGANAQFLGNGATEFTLNEINTAAISGDGIEIKGEPGKVGVPEMLTIEKNPPSIKQLEQKGALKAIPLKGPAV